MTESLQDSSIVACTSLKVISSLNLKICRNNDRGVTEATKGRKG